MFQNDNENGKFLRPRYLIWAFLYFASDCGRKPLPTDREAISASFVAGFIEWLTGQPAYDGDLRLKVKEPIFEWEEWANRELEKVIALKTKKARVVGFWIVSEVWEILQYKWRGVPPDFYGWVNEVEDWLRHSGYDFVNAGSFNLSVADVDMVEEEAVPYLGSHIMECLKEIAEKAQKYITQFMLWRN